MISNFARFMFPALLIAMGLTQCSPEPANLASAQSDGEAGERREGERAAFMRKNSPT